MSKKTIIDFNEIIESNKCGPFRFIEGTECHRSGRLYVEAEFLNTGFRKMVDYRTAKNGLIQDPYAPLLCGVGRYGIPKRVYSKKELYCWQDMIRRCYENINKHKSYYGKITVCERWQYFEYFLDDIPYLPGYTEWLTEGNNYHLDKDKLQQNIPHDERVYSPTTCVFISNEENNILRTKENNKTGICGAEITPDGTYCVRYYHQYLGRFDDPIAAATIHNYYCNFNKTPQLNDNTDMSIFEALKHKKGKRPVIAIIKV